MTPRATGIALVDGDRRRIGRAGIDRVASGIERIGGAGGGTGEQRAAVGPARIGQRYQPLVQHRQLLADRGALRVRQRAVSPPAPPADGRARLRRRWRTKRRRRRRRDRAAAAGRVGGEAVGAGIGAGQRAQPGRRRAGSSDAAVCRSPVATWRWRSSALRAQSGKPVRLARQRGEGGVDRKHQRIASIESKMSVAAWITRAEAWNACWKRRRLAASASRSTAVSCSSEEAALSAIASSASRVSASPAIMADSRESAVVETCRHPRPPRRRVRRGCPRRGCLRPRRRGAVASGLPVAARSAAVVPESSGAPGVPSGAMPFACAALGALGEDRRPARRDRRADRRSGRPPCASPASDPAAGAAGVAVEREGQAAVGRDGQVERPRGALLDQQRVRPAGQRHERPAPPIDRAFGAGQLGQVAHRRVAPVAQHRRRCASGRRAGRCRD